MKLNPALAHRVVQGQAFAMDPKLRTLHSFNETGTAVWKGIVQGLTPEEIARGLAAAFDVSPEKALSDVKALISELLARGVLVEA